MKRTTFWGRDENDEHLVDEIVAGEKTCTCYPKAWYDNQEEDEKYDIGELVQVFSKKGKHLCTIEITEKYDIPFGEADEKIIKGEVCNSFKHFTEAHHLAWDEEFKKRGKQLTGETIITVEHFKLVSVEK